MSRQTFVLYGRNSREAAVQYIRTAPDGTSVDCRNRRRSLDQNAKLWAMLSDISRQVQWHGEHLSPADWKDLATASLRKCRFVPGLDPGTVVPLGMRTSEMTKAECSDLLELLNAFAAEHGVVFSGEASDAA